MAQTQDAALTNKTVVDKGSKGETIYKSTVNIDYPKVDVLTLLFGEYSARFNVNCLVSRLIAV